MRRIIHISTPFFSLFLSSLQVHGDNESAPAPHGQTYNAVHRSRNMAGRNYFIVSNVGILHNIQSGTEEWRSADCLLRRMARWSNKSFAAGICVGILFPSFYVVYTASEIQKDCALWVTDEVGCVKQREGAGRFSTLCTDSFVIQ